MKEIKETTYKGTRILFGNEKRNIVDFAICLAQAKGFIEISIPIIQHQEIFTGKVGEENNNMMFNFRDHGDRDLCLAPEYTAVVQRLAKTAFKMNKDVKMFYVQECFRGERPQAGRYRQFTQFGVEILNPTKDYTSELVVLASSVIAQSTLNFQVNTDATRGLDYYQGGKGFEISCPDLGAQSQVCGGGAYECGVGFAIGVDRLLLLNK